MRIMNIALVAIGGLLAATPAHAWGAQGHQLVGSTAQRILEDGDHAAAASKLHSLLGGYDLAAAATWADCVRNVKKSKTKGFIYVHSPKSAAICKKFETKVEMSRMIQYASRNWTQCKYNPGCHGAYHFADVAIQHDHYSRDYVGTSDHDIVAAINACILVLQGDPSPAPFAIKTKREALFLLAHFVGDLHQPLHVGAVYLKANGQRIDPDGDPSKAEEEQTRGGNSIDDGSTNLHSEWDSVLSSWGVVADDNSENDHNDDDGNNLLPDARGVGKTSGAISGWAAKWATETVKEAQGAFDGLTFSKKNADGHWTVHYNNHPDYLEMKKDEQRQQVARAGARLAEILTHVWE